MFMDCILRKRQRASSDNIVHLRCALPTIKARVTACPTLHLSAASSGGQTFGGHIHLPARQVKPGRRQRKTGRASAQGFAVTASPTHGSSCPYPDLGTSS